MKKEIKKIERLNIWADLKTNLAVLLKVNEIIDFLNTEFDERQKAWREAEIAGRDSTWGGGEWGK